MGVSVHDGRDLAFFTVFAMTQKSSKGTVYTGQMFSG